MYQTSVLRNIFSGSLLIVVHIHPVVVHTANHPCQQFAFDRVEHAHLILSLGHFALVVLLQPCIMFDCGQRSHVQVALDFLVDLWCTLVFPRMLVPEEYLNGATPQ
jgi:hypothetical protein